MHGRSLRSLQLHSNGVRELGAPAENLGHSPAAVPEQFYAMI